MKHAKPSPCNCRIIVKDRAACQPTGAKVDRWLCELCGSEFVPRAEVAAETEECAKLIEAPRIVMPLNDEPIEETVAFVQTCIAATVRQRIGDRI